LAAKGAAPAPRLGAAAPSGNRAGNRSLPQRRDPRRRRQIDSHDILASDAPMHGSTDLPKGTSLQKNWFFL
jgi:hypothetical protein